MQTGRLYRELVVTFLECAKNTKAPTDCDQLIAGAVHYQKLARAAASANDAAQNWAPR
jgi:hypothetical protein